MIREQHGMLTEAERNCILGSREREDTLPGVRQVRGASPTARIFEPESYVGQVAETILIAVSFM